MSQQQFQRSNVIENAAQGRLTVSQAAELLHLSRRQVKRLKARYQPDHPAWVLHGNAGRIPHNRTTESVRQQVIAFAKGKYRGFNDSHLCEKLVQVERLPLSRETVRVVLRCAGLPSPQSRRPRRYRGRRERRPQFGMMVLTDASPHDWLEGRGPRLTLVGQMDDATSTVLAARFQLAPEDTAGYLVTLRRMVETHGVPASLYRDQHSTFQRNDRYWTLEEELAGRQTPTQLGRVLEELSITQIAALSPQAKGRIERLWRTFQDRLISELRLAGAHDLDSANHVLEGFLPEFNRRFAVQPPKAGSLFRRLDRRVNLDRIFCLRYERVVAKDHTIPFGPHTIQLPPLPAHRGYAGQTVQLCHQPNGELQVYLQDRLLLNTRLGAPTEPVRSRPVKRKQPTKKLPRIYFFAGTPALAIRP